MHRSLSEAGAADDRYQVIRFDSYELRLDEERWRAAGATSGDRLSLSKLRTKAAAETRETGRVDPKTARDLFAAYKDRAFPFATFWLGVLGVPLGISTRRAGRMGGFGFGILAVGAYYLLLIAADAIAARAWLPPPLAAWLPTAVLAAVTVGLVVMMDRGRPRFGRR
jgi:lipopolysaccharide export system permease protein